MASFQFTREEFVAASMGLAKKRTIRFILLMVFLIAAVATFRVISNNNLLAAAPYLFAIFMMVPTVIFVSKYRLAKTFDDQPSLRETFNVEINAEGIRYSHSTGSKFLAWDRIRKWAEDRRFIYLFESDHYARILPKRALSVEEDAAIRSKLSANPDA